MRGLSPEREAPPAPVWGEPFGSATLGEAVPAAPELPTEEPLGEAELPLVAAAPPAEPPPGEAPPLLPVEPPPPVTPLPPPVVVGGVVVVVTGGVVVLVTGGVVVVVTGGVVVVVTGGVGVAKLLVNVLMHVTVLPPPLEEPLHWVMVTGRAVAAPVTEHVTRPGAPPPFPDPLH